MAGYASSVHEARVAKPTGKRGCYRRSLAAYSGDAIDSSAECSSIRDSVITIGKILMTLNFSITVEITNWLKGYHKILRSVGIKDA